MPQSYRDKLVRHVCCHRRCSVIEAEQYLNQGCPDWVKSDPPVAIKKEIDDEDESEES